MYHGEIPVCIACGWCMTLKYTSTLSSIKSNPEQKKYMLKVLGLFILYLLYYTSSELIDIYEKFAINVFPYNPFLGQML